MKISFHTLGCKLNQAETEELKKDLVQRGFSVVLFGAHEDVAVVRACGVTVDASQTTREMIRRAKRRGAYVIAVGCLENKDLPEIDFVARGNEEVVSHCEARRGAVGCVLASLGREASAMPLRRHKALRTHPTARLRNDRTRTLIKIQTGCNFNCAYCIIPSFRGRTRSVPSEAVIKKIKEAEKDGYKEAVLTGVNICQYKDSSHPPFVPPSGSGGDLAELLKKILRETKIERIRLGSLDPRLISEKLIKLFLPPFYSPLKKGGQNRLMPHWHLSLQSGSDTMLKRMRRGYNAKQYLGIVQKLRQANPLFSFTTDIIVGFPGETEKEFTETCAFVKKMSAQDGPAFGGGFAKIHVFPFSPRPGTAAAKMPNQVQDKIKTERVKKLLKISKAEAKKFAAKFTGKTRPVLFEQKKSGYFAGYTPEFVRVRVKSKQTLQNKIKEIKI